MPRKFFRKYLPHADRMRAHRLVAMFGRFLQAPNLWHLNRDSVAGAMSRVPSNSVSVACGWPPISAPADHRK